MGHVTTYAEIAIIIRDRGPANLSMCVFRLVSPQKLPIHLQLSKRSCCTNNLIQLPCKLQESTLQFSPYAKFKTNRLNANQSRCGIVLFKWEKRLSYAHVAHRQRVFYYRLWSMYTFGWRISPSFLYDCPCLCFSTSTSARALSDSCSIHVFMAIFVYNCICFCMQMDGNDYIVMFSLFCISKESWTPNSVIRLRAHIDHRVYGIDPSAENGNC